MRNSQKHVQKACALEPEIPAYGAFLNLHGQPVLIVGGGTVAARKAATLLASGARVTLVAPHFDATLLKLKKLRANGSLQLLQRPFRVSDLKHQRLVFAATDDPKLNARICRAAEQKNIWSNCAAPPEAGSFSVPATVTRGRFALAVSTQGASPALAAHWRKRLEKLVGPEWGELATLQISLRKLAHERIKNPAKRRKLLLKIGHPKWAAKIKRLGVTAVKREMLALLFNDK